MAGNASVLYDAEVKGVDEFLADAGYNVRPCELREVANKLQRLEMVLDAAQDAGISHLSSEAVHYNPSDLGGWVESMLQELSSGYPAPAVSGPATVPTDAAPGDEFADAAAGFLEEEYELHNYYGVGEGMADRLDGLFLPAADPYCFFLPHPDDSGSSSMEIQSGHDILREENRHNSSSSPASTDQTGRGRTRRAEEGFEAAPAGGLVPGSNPAPQDLGVRLVHALMGCAEAIQRNDLAAAEDMVEQIRALASSLGGAMGKVAAYFAEALARRIHGFPAGDGMYAREDSLSELLQARFYETCPYLKFAHFTANQAILEALEGHKRVHVIDFNLQQGVQWPALIQALALRPGGPPAFRLTGIGPPRPDGNDALHEVGLKLAQLAESVHVEFDFRGLAASSLRDVKAWMLDVRPGEAVAVNSVFQLHRLLYPNPAPLDEVLALVRRLNPRIVTVVEQEADHNSPVFLERFTECLHYYSAVFDSLEACRLPVQSPAQVLSEMYLGRDICNIVACEGPERVERHQTLMQWRLRMHGAGFRPLHLGSNAFKQASMLLTLFSGGDEYRVEENNGCLTLGWHGRPLIAASAWHCC